MSVNEVDEVPMRAAAAMLAATGIPSHQLDPLWVVTVEALARVLDPVAHHRLCSMIRETRQRAHAEGCADVRRHLEGRALHPSQRVCHLAIVAATSDHTEGV